MAAKKSRKRVAKKPPVSGALVAVRKRGGQTLEDLMPGNGNAAARDAVVQRGEYSSKNGKHTVRVQTRPILGTDQHEVMAVAAVSRDPGRSSDFVDTIADFLPKANNNRANTVAQLWRIYSAEGIVNNAVNKIAATLSPGGKFKVKHAKKGKVRKAGEILQAILDDFVSNINNARDDGAVTGSRGLQAVTLQAVRMALVEGSWIGRAVWGKKRIFVNGTQGAYSVPLNIQSLTTAEIEPVEGLSSVNFEAFYWKPPEAIKKLLRDPKAVPKELKDKLNKFMAKDLQSQIIKDGKVFLDPALLIHVKHRPVDTQPFGDSFITPAMQGIAFKRSVEALDMVSMQNLINRLTIIMVGSDDPKSPYSKAEVQQARTALMQSLLEDPGPNMTIVWQGPDVNVTDVGANATLSLDERHVISENKIKMALGVPEALLSGSTSDGKSSGWAAALGAAAELLELQNAFANSWTTIGQRIATENGFEDVDVIFEFNNSLMIDKAEEWNQLRLDVIAGLISMRTYHLGRGYDHDAEYIQKCLEKGVDPDPEATGSTIADVFAPMQGLPGQGTGGGPPGVKNTAPGSGRTPDSTTGAPAKTAPSKPSVKENK